MPGLNPNKAFTIAAVGFAMLMIGWQIQRYVGVRRDARLSGVAVPMSSTVGIVIAALMATAGAFLILVTLLNW